MKIIIVFLIFSVIFSKIEAADNEWISQKQQEILLEPVDNVDPNVSMDSDIEYSGLPDGQVCQQLNAQLEGLNDNFIRHYTKHYHLGEFQIYGEIFQTENHLELNLTRIQANTSCFLLLVGKMYLYNILPRHPTNDEEAWPLYKTDSPLLAAYYYLKMSAHYYQNSEAYYYLGLMEYHRLIPDTTIFKHLELKSNRDFKENLLHQYLKTSHVSKVENSFFLSAVLGSNAASLVLANMNKEGIGMPENCTSSIAYYLSVLKNTYIDTYEFRSLYSDEEPFDDELYSGIKATFVTESTQYSELIEDTMYLDDENTKAVIELADNYYIGKNGYRRNYTKAAQLYKKLVHSNNKGAMTMLGMCYFKGQGVPLDRTKAKLLFQSSKDDVSSYMLIAMKYFGLEGPHEKIIAINQLKDIYKLSQKNNHKKINSLYLYLIGSLIVKGQFPDIKRDEGFVLLEQSALMGNVMSKLAMGLFFIDGAAGLGYDCKRASTYFAEESIQLPFFKDKIHLAKIALMKKLYSFSFIKYLELTLIGHEDAFVNALYVLQIYQHEALSFSKHTWSVAAFQQNKLYGLLVKNKNIVEMESHLIKEYTISGNKLMTYEKLRSFTVGNDSIAEDYRTYVKMKIIKIAYATKSNSLMNFFYYKLQLAQGNDPTNILSTVAAGKSQHLHVLQARYLLGKHLHTKYSKMNRSSEPVYNFKIITQYNRATKSQVLGQFVYFIQDYLLKGQDFDWDSLQPGIVQDFLAYTFTLCIICFAFYYIRSKRLDELHAIEMAKTLQRQRMARIEEEDKKRIQRLQKLIWQERQMKKEVEVDRNQPIITEDVIIKPFKREQERGIRIGSSNEGF